MEEMEKKVEETTEVQEPKKKKLGKRKIIGIVTGALAVVGAAVVTVIRHKSGDSEDVELGEDLTGEPIDSMTE